METSKTYKFTSVPLKQDWEQDLPRYWFGGSPLKTHFMNAMGILIPTSEAALIHVMKDSVALASDPDIIRQVKELIAQESWHSYSHTRYNKWLESIGLPVQEITDKNLATIAKNRTHLANGKWLSGMVCAEHNAAVFLEFLLSHPKLLDQMHPHFRQAWVWHGVEEIEHKGVALDLWTHILPKLDTSVLKIKTIGLFLASGSFNLRILKVMFTLLAHDKQLRKWRTLKDGLSFFLGRQGVWTNTFLPWIAFMKPSFHPWDKDTRYLLAKFPKTIDTGTI